MQTAAAAHEKFVHWRYPERCWVDNLQVLSLQRPHTRAQANLGHELDGWIYLSEELTMATLLACLNRVYLHQHLIAGSVPQRW